jgi:hypothetical protein
VRVKVIATNVKGDSLESSIGEGAIIITAPDAPINLVELTGFRDPTTLALAWSQGSANGASPVTEYRINIAEQGGVWNVLDSTSSTTYTASSLTSGVTY